jgi:hypothetical protein
VLVLDHEALVLNPHGPPVARDQPILGAKRICRLVAMVHQSEDSLPVVWVQQLGKELGVGEPFLHRIPEQRLDLGARVERGRAGRERVDVGNEGKLLDQGPVLGLGGAQPSLGARPAQKSI